VYNHLRDSMYKRISDQTGYNLLLLKDDKNWLMDVLLGHGLQRKEVREKVGTAVATYVALAMKIRKQDLSLLLDLWAKIDPGRSGIDPDRCQKKIDPDRFYRSGPIRSDIKIGSIRVDPGPIKIDPRSIPDRSGSIFVIGQNR
jgi:hypothetical protein